MTVDPMETVRGLYGAMRSRDLDELRRLGRQNPRFEWTASADEIDASARMPPAAALEYTRELFEIFDRVQTEIVEEVEVSEDRIILVVEHRVRIGVADDDPPRVDPLVGEDAQLVEPDR